MKQTPLVLVDGSSYFFRAYHALPPLTNSHGQPLGAVYGVVNMVRRLIKDYQPQRLAVVFDAKGKTFRNDLYQEYKATRPPTPEDLEVQFEPMVEVLDAMGLPILIVEGVEADDVIGTLAHQATHAGLDTVISTGDKDMAQLVNDHVTLVNTMTQTVLDEQGVKDKFGVYPGQIVDYLALIGDKSDNVPGIDKVGPKTAVKWLAEHETVEAIISDADSFKGKVGEYLRAGLTQLPLSKQLVTIKTDVSLGMALEDLYPTVADEEGLLALYRKYEFRSWLKQLTAQNQQDDEQVVTPPVRYQTVSDEQGLNELLAVLQSASLVAIDTETTDCLPMQASLVGLSFAVKPHQAWYVPVAHVEGQQLPKAQVLAALKPIFEDPKIAKLGQNLKYDLNVLRQEDIALKGTLFDTMMASYVLNSTQVRHNLDAMAEKYLAINTQTFESVAGKGSKQLTFDQVPIDKASHYAAEDADVTLRLHKYLLPRVKAIPKLRQVYESIELPLVPVLAAMEFQGVLVDAEVLEAQGRELRQRLQRLESQAYELAGETFNLNSPKQLQALLYDKLNLPVLKKTPKGQPSTAEVALHELAYDFELPKVILAYRSLFKLVTTYLDALPRRINARTGRVHTSYNQAVTATGRLSSSDPNLQNIPVRTPEGRAIRLAFVAPAGYCLLACDYSQIELRIMAHLSQDPQLLSAFAQGLDIHRATAAEVFGVSIDAVTDEQRRRAKAVNFGLIYGMSAFGLAKQLGVERHEAQSYIDVYFARYPGVLVYMTQTRGMAHQQGYVETLSGRRLYLPDIHAKNKLQVKAAERTAINAPMQGTAADIIKRAMITIHQWITSSSAMVNMVMQVHDELVFEVKTEHLADVRQQIIQLMEGAFNLDVPLVVSAGDGPNWEAAH